MKDRWHIAALLLMALICGYVVGRGGLAPGAQAQSESAAGRVAVVIGQERNGRAPIVLVDSLEQSIVVYEWSYASRNIQLKSARTYRHDKLLQELDNAPPSVRDIQGLLQRR